MLTRPCRPRRICFLTDVEGDMAYFRRFVRLSTTLCWRPKEGSQSTATAATRPAVTQATQTAPCTADIPDELSDHDLLQRYVLDFIDARDAGCESHFVFGGDAFDHGADLAFARSLLDLRARHPHRVHLILGNRDINKMVMGPLMQDVARLTPDEAEQRAFPRQSTALLARQQSQATAAHPLHRPSYAEYLLQRHGHVPRRANPVSFLQWALPNKLGSSDAFEHRRRELQGNGRQIAPQSSPPRREVGDREVADSFFAAAARGGVYERYLAEARLMTTLDEALFVHGGINGNNVGFVPAVHTPHCSCEEGNVMAALHAATLRGAVPGRRLWPECRELRVWLDALQAFKEESLHAWRAQRGTCGEALRHYAFPRLSAPHSVVVNSCIDASGPHYAALPVVDYLVCNGVQICCTGHQPSGDSPALVRQPGELLLVAADNSYSGRRRYSGVYDRYNRRGHAVTEVILSAGHGLAPRGDDDITAKQSSDAARQRAHGSEERRGGRGEEEEVVVVAGTAEDEDEAARVGMRRVWVHGRRASGANFAFDATDPLLGRHVGEGWWSKVVSLAASPSCSAAQDVRPPFYELHRTRDEFHSEEVRVVDRATLREMLARHREPPVAGELPARFTQADLAERTTHVHRVKTKVTPPYTSNTK